MEDNNTYVIATIEAVDTNTIHEKVTRGFKGLWFPKELWFNKELTWMEKLFLLEIDSLDNEMGCFASNNYFADFFNLSAGRCSQIISGLKDKGYIEIEYTREGKQIKQRVLKILKGGIKYSKGGYLENDKGRILISKNTNNSIYIPFLEEWNKKEHLPTHKSNTVKLKIKKRHTDILKAYSREDILYAINAYNTILGEDKYWYTHRFTFWDFIARGIDNFMPNMKPYMNYLSNKKDKYVSPELKIKPITSVRDLEENLD